MTLARIRVGLLVQNLPQGITHPAVKPRLDSFAAVLEDDDEVSETPVDESLMHPGQPTFSALKMTPEPSQLSQTNAGTVTPPERKPQDDLASTRGERVGN